MTFLAVPRFAPQLYSATRSYVKADRDLQRGTHRRLGGRTQCLLFVLLCAGLYRSDTREPGNWCINDRILYRRRPSLVRYFARRQYPY